MRTILALLLAASGVATCQTASFPNALPTDADLMVAFDRATTSLSSGINSSTLTIPVANGAVFPLTAGQATLITIENEQIRICSRSGNTLTACASGRGYSGSTAAAHVSGRAVEGRQGSWFHNRLRAEIQAMGTTLGERLMNLGVFSARHDWTPQQPGGTLSAGVAATVNMNPCAAGVNAANFEYWIYIYDGTGTPEAAKVTGGSCISGAASGTLIFTPANAHSGSWKIKSVAAGLSEAIAVATAAGGGGVMMPPGTIHVLGPVGVPIVVPTSGPQLTIAGTGRGNTWLSVELAGTAARAASGVFILGYGLAATFQDFSMTADQPYCEDDDRNYICDTGTGLASFTHWPAFIDGSKASRGTINRLLIQGAWDGINLSDSTGRQGPPSGWTVTDLRIGAWHVNIDVNGGSDTMRFSDIHIWPFGAPWVGAQSDFFKPEVIGMRIYQCDACMVHNLFTISGTALYLGNPGTAFNPNLTLTHGFFDGYARIVMNGGGFQWTGGEWFHVDTFAENAYVPSGGPAGRYSTCDQAGMYLYGGTVSITNIYAEQRCVAAPLISSARNSVETNYDLGGTPTLTITGSQFRNQFYGSSPTAQQAFLLSDNSVPIADYITLIGNQFTRKPGITYTVPAIGIYDQVTQGGTRLVMQGNTFTAMGSGSSTALSVKYDTQHRITGNTFQDHNFVRPVGVLSNGTYEVDGSTWGANVATVPGTAQASRVSCKEGSPAPCGVATLASGAVTVANTYVGAATRIFLTPQDCASTGSVRVSARSVGTSFTITSSDAASTCSVAYYFVEPAP